MSWVEVGGGSGSGAATDPIYDAKGDIAVGTGSDAAAKLTVGTDGYVLTADSTGAGGSVGMKWAAPNNGLVGGLIGGLGA